MSRKKILPTYVFKLSEDLEKITGEKVRVQAVVWEKPNDHPHDGGIYKIVEPYLDVNGLPPKGNCPDCHLPMKNHGLIKTKEKVDPLDIGYKVCPGDWVLHQNHDYWPCSKELFEELYQLLPKKEWYGNRKP